MHYSRRAITRNYSDIYVSIPLTDGNDTPFLAKYLQTCRVRRWSVLLSYSYIVGQR